MKPPARRRPAALAAARQPRAHPPEEPEWCLLQWRPDFSPAGDAEGHAAALWRTRPPGTVVNGRANRELTADSATQDLLEVAQHVKALVILVQGVDDPRPPLDSDQRPAERVAACATHRLGPSRSRSLEGAP